MRIKIGKQQIPWAMAAGRALLRPVLILGEECGWSGPMMAWLVVAALVSDIFDGVLARRWNCDTAGMRLFDTMADTFFYLCVAIALWIGQPQIWRNHAGLLMAVLAAEGMNLALAFAKFGKPASYHSYLAKTWGLVLATAVVAALISGQSNVLIPIALAMGVASNVEGVAMSLVLPVWRKDVKTLRVAWRLRQEMRDDSKLTAWATKLPVAAGIILCLLAVPAFAAETGEAAYEGGSIGLARDTTASDRPGAPAEHSCPQHGQDVPARRGRIRCGSGGHSHSYRVIMRTVLPGQGAVLPVNARGLQIGSRPCAVRLRPSSGRLTRWTGTVRAGLDHGDQDLPPVQGRVRVAARADHAVLGHRPAGPGRSDPARPGHGDRPAAAVRVRGRDGRCPGTERLVPAVPAGPDATTKAVRREATVTRWAIDSKTRGRNIAAREPSFQPTMPGRAPAVRPVRRGGSRPGSAGAAWPGWRRSAPASRSRSGS